jgi:hypothetical protein
MKVIFYTWSLEKGDIELIERIKKAFQQLLNDSILLEKDKQIETEIIELASYGEVLHDSGIGLAFGSIRGITDPYGYVEELPPLSCLTGNKENKKWREAAFEKLGMIVNYMQDMCTESTKAQLGEPLEEAKVYIETKEGYTVGKKNTDFIIDETTAEYVRKIKNLVGGRAYMEKNGIKVEIK